MTDCQVGYAGGDEPFPTYNSIKDHTEATIIQFDPTVITYEQLLAQFFHEHNAHVPGYSRQYRSMVLYRSEEQRTAAETAIADREASKGAKVHTALEPCGEVYRAEEYHQKYIQKHSGGGRWF